jgi:hypothetical protein
MNTSSTSPAIGQLVIYPSPANANTIVEFNSVQNGMSEITVFDQSGFPVLKQSIITTEGSNTKILDLSRLRNGIYMVQLQQGANQERSKIDRTALIK